MQEAIIKRDKILEDAGETAVEIYDRIIQIAQDAKLYKTAWLELAKCLGETMNQDALDLMDSVLSGVKIDLGVQVENEIK